MYYTCNAKGQCEENNDGVLTREQCEANCRPLDRGDRDAYDLYLETLMLDPELAVQAAPSEKLDLIRRITRVSLSDYSAEYTTEILLKIMYKDYPNLWSLPEFRLWLLEQPDWDPFCIVISSFQTHYDLVASMNWQYTATSIRLFISKQYRLRGVIDYIILAEELTSLFDYPELAMAVYQHWEPTVDDMIVITDYLSTLSQ